MGLFDRLRGDPMQRAERRLARGDIRGALALLERLPASPARDGLVTGARTSLIQSLVAKADGAEAEDYAEDAVQWLRGALEEIDAGADGRHADLGAALRERLDRLEERVAAETEARERSAYDLELGGEPAVAGFELADDALFDAYVGMLRPAVQTQYQAAGTAFAEACSRLHGGDVETALAALATLGDEAVVCLERGRGHLLAGDAATAAADFETAWQTLGEETLDEAASWSIPRLWAEAALESGRPGDVVSRLEPLATALRADVAEAYAQALLTTGAADEAARFLAGMLAHAASPPLFRLMAEAADAAGDPSAAVAVLEQSIAACCGTGSCRKTPLDTETVHMLVERYLARGEEADIPRCHELLSRYLAERQGRVGAADCRLLARYFRAIGDVERAEEAEAVAGSAASDGIVGWSSGLGGATGQAIL